MVSKDEESILGPKVKYRLTATCGKCNHSVNKDVEVEEINIGSEQLKFTNEAASSHKEHPDLNSYKVTAVKR